MQSSEKKGWLDGRLSGPAAARGGAYEASVFAELGRSGEKFDAIYTASASGFSAAYFAAGQPEKSEYVWRNMITGRRLVNFTNGLRGRKILDLAYLIHIYQNDPGRLDVDKIFTGGTRIVCAVLDAQTGMVSYLTPSRSTLFGILMASAAVPFVHGKIMLFDRFYFDGGLLDPLPVMKAWEDGYRDIVAVYNRPLILQKARGTRFIEHLTSLLPAPYSRLLRNKSEQIRKTEEFLASHPEVAVIRPYKTLPPRHVLDFNHARINKAADIGIADAKRYLKVSARC